VLLQRRADVVRGWRRAYLSLHEPSLVQPLDPQRAGL